MISMPAARRPESVNHAVPHADDLTPWYFRMSVSHLIGQSCRSFSDDLDQMHKGKLDVLVCFERRTSIGYLCGNLVGGVENVGQPFGVAPHSATASARIRSCMRFFRPRSVATWVKTPNRSSTSSANAAMSK